MSRHLVVASIALGLIFAFAGSVRAAGPESQFFMADGVRLHYLIEGKGEPVVLLHGLFSDAEKNWVSTGIFGELAKDHQVIALDFPGFGLSARPDNKKAYGIGLVADVVKLLDHLNIKKANLVGYSAGGLVALKLMSMHPDRVLSGTICAMGWLKEGSVSQRFWGDLTFLRIGLLPMAFLEGIGELALTEPQLKRIANPVELIVGDRDPVKELFVEPLRQVRPDWPVVEIKNAGHIDCVQKKQFREAIGAWIRKNSKR